MVCPVWPTGVALRISVRIRLAGVAALAAASALTLPGISTAAASTLIYVSPNGHTGNDDSGCSAASHTTIQSAVDDVAQGGTVIVCAGTYAESVSIAKMLTLRGFGDPVIDAAGKPYGIGLGADNVTVRGMVVEHAKADQQKQWPGDGIVTASLATGQPVTSNNAAIINNIVRDNQGAGIDLESTRGVLVAGNRSVRNDIGVNIANDLGKPSHSNTVTDNVTSHSTECGIVLADHSGLGVYRNNIIGNVALFNGAASKTGAGIQLASPTKGGSVRENTIRGNAVYGNGHGGITMHSHAPDQDFSFNRFIDNTIGRNNVRTDYKDAKTTGIYIGSVAKVTVLVARNLIYRNAVGVFTIGNVTLHRFGNTYTNVTTPLMHLGKYAG